MGGFFLKRMYAPTGIQAGVHFREIPETFFHLLGRSNAGMASFAWAALRIQGSHCTMFREASISRSRTSHHAGGRIVGASCLRLSPWDRSTGFCKGRSTTRTSSRYRHHGTPDRRARRPTRIGIQSSCQVVP
jgi:hypothetical protein